MKHFSRGRRLCLLAPAAAILGGIVLTACGGPAVSSATITIKPVSGPSTAGMAGTTGSPSTLPTAARSSMSGMPTAAAPAAAGPPVLADAVIIRNFAFGPKVVMVTAGTAVHWTNNDTEAHTVTSDTGLFSSPVLQPGASYSYTFSKQGTYSYHCTIHPFMTGKVIVK